MTRGLRASALVIALATARCVGDGPAANASADATSDTSPASDASLGDAAVNGDAGPACDLSKPFGTPVNIAELNTSADENDARLTGDERGVYFAQGAPGAHQLFTASRAGASGAFGSASKLNLDIAGPDFVSPFVTDAGALYFATNFADAGMGSYDVFTATPPSSVSFTDVPSINTPSSEYGVWVLADVSAVFFASSRPGGVGGDDIWSAPIVSGNFGAPALVANVNGTAFDDGPALTADGLTLYFSSARAGTGDIFVATRSSVSGSFTTPTPVTELNTSDGDYVDWVSGDGCAMIMHTNHAYPGAKGAYDIYRVEKPPL